MNGIAYARDEQHRMTPLSPWFYFWMKSKPLLRLVFVYAFPWLIITVTIPWVLAYSNWFTFISWKDAFPAFWKELKKDDVLRWLLTMDVISIMGLASLMFATITTIAPRLSSSLLIASIGVGFAMLLWRILMLLCGAYHIGSETVAGPFSLLSILSFVLVWLHVRFKLNRAWFRFDDP